MARQFTCRSLLAACICFAASATASGQALGPDARPFAGCERISDARRLDLLHRSGIAAVRCRVAPTVHLAILVDDTVSWPMIRNRNNPWVSLEDPVAAKVWLPNTSPLQVRLDRDAYVAIGPANAPRAISTPPLPVAPTLRGISISWSRCVCGLRVFSP